MNKFKKILDYFVCIVFSISLIILLGCIAILPIAKSKSYYLKQHEKNNVKQILQKYSFRGGYSKCLDRNGNMITYYVPYHLVTDDDIKNATTHIIDYLYSEKVTSMQFQVSSVEGPVDFFSEQAIVHMEDVKVLFIGGIKLCYISIILFIASLIYIIFTKERNFKRVLRIYLKTLLAFFIIAIGLILFAIIDFDVAFEVFHKVIFPDSNKVELALSFTYTDTLTNVLTIEFFMNIGMWIGIIFVSLIVLSIGTDIVLLKLDKIKNYFSNKKIKTEN